MAKVLKKKVKLIKHDITCATAGEPTLCPVAKALNRQHKQKGWTVHGSDEIISPHGKRYVTSPKDADKVYTFINDFDMGNKVKPISFELVPDATAFFNDYSTEW